MCTLVILFRPQHPWPVLIAGNRDEMKDRTWLAPDYHWPNHPHTFAGKDLLSGGSWLGINKQNLFAAINNRSGSLGPQEGKVSRGNLILDALDHGDVKAAVQYLSSKNYQSYRGFNLLLADSQQLYWLRHVDENAKVECFSIEPGIHMLRATELDDLDDPCIKAYLPKFTSATPQLERDDWSNWVKLLSHLNPKNSAAAINFSLASGFGTVSSHLVAIPPNGNIRFWFAPGPPHLEKYRCLL